MHAAPPPPIFRRIAQVFVAPRRLFEGFRMETPWAGVLVISVLVAMVAAASLPASHFIEQMRNPVDRLGRPVVVTSDPATVVFWGRILLAFSAAVMQPIVAFVLAGILLLIFTWWLGGEARYPQYLAVVTHVLLIPALGTLGVLAASWIRGGVLPEPSLALLVPFLRGDSFPVRLLQALNPFTLWALAVAALGVSTLNRNRSWSGAALPLFALLLTVAAVAAAPG